MEWYKQMDECFNNFSIFMSVEHHMKLYEDQSEFFKIKIGWIMKKKKLWVLLIYFQLTKLKFLKKNFFFCYFKNLFLNYIVSHIIIWKESIVKNFISQKITTEPP